MTAMAPSWSSHCLFLLPPAWKRAALRAPPPPGTHVGLAGLSVCHGSAGPSPEGRGSAPVTVASSLLSVRSEDVGDFPPMGHAAGTCLAAVLKRNLGQNEPAMALLSARCSGLDVSSNTQVQIAAALPKF